MRNDAAKRNPQAPEKKERILNSVAVFDLQQCYVHAYQTLRCMLSGFITLRDSIDLLNEPSDHIARRPAMTAEPELFRDLMKTKSARRVKELVQTSRYLKNTEAGKALKRRAAEFISFKQTNRFPKDSSERQVDMAARAIAAFMMGMQSSTGVRYLSGGVQQCPNCGREAIVLVDQNGKEKPWCGQCL
jgi:hypothetical protein